MYTSLIFRYMQWFGAVLIRMCACVASKLCLLIYADDLETATFQDLCRVGFTRTFAKKLVQLRGDADWNQNKIWKLKKEGGLGLGPSHYHALRHAKITDAGQVLDMGAFIQKNKQVICMLNTHHIKLYDIIHIYTKLDTY